MLIFNESFFLKIRRLLYVFILFLIFFMVFAKCKIYNLKKEIREIDNNILELYRNKDSLITELNYLSNPERLNKIYSKLLGKKLINERFIISHREIKDMQSIKNYYARKNEKQNKNVTTVVSNGK